MPFICHNAVRDITAQLLTRVCPNVGVEPQLQPLSGERFPLRSTNVEDNARLDMRTQNFWDKSKRTTFFDVRVFNSHAPSNCSSSSDASYRRHKREKRRSYEQRILEVDHGTFTPLVLSSSGGWGMCAFIVFTRTSGRCILGISSTAIIYPRDDLKNGNRCGPIKIPTPRDPPTPSVMKRCVLYLLPAT